MDLRSRPRSASVFALALVLALAACGGGGVAGGRGDASGQLAPLGPSAVRLHPGGRRRLEVVLAQEGVGPVRGARIEFAIGDGDAAGAVLDRASATTDASGVASVEVAAGALTAGGGFQVVARAPDHAGAEPAVFAVSVIAVRRTLQIAPGPQIQVDGGGQTAQATLFASSSLALKVRERDEDTGEPISGDVLTFAIGGSGVGAAFAGGAAQTTAATSGAGEAQVFLLSSARAERFFVSVSPAAGDAVGVTFAVTVGDGGAGAACASSQQCPAGQVCRNGWCGIGTGGGCGGATPCPVGPGAMPDASGVWYTKHVFALDGALPKALGQVFAGLRVVDQALSGALGLPPWLQSVLDGIVAQYVPDWARIVIRIGDTLGTLVSHLRSQGALRLSRASGTDPAQLAGSEVWTGLAVYFLPQCCPGGPLAGSCPALRGDPTEPLECARIDLPTTDADGGAGAVQCHGRPIPALKVDARPFQATVAGSGAAHDQAPWTLNVSAREVDLRMGTVLLVAVDTLLGLFTPWHCIDEATDCAGSGPCIADCASLGGSLSRLTGGLLDAAGVERLCGGVVAAAGRQVTQSLDGAAFEVDALRFSGRARISGFAGDGAGTVPPDDGTCDSGQLCGNQLGANDFDQRTRADARAGTSSRDGSWEGSFFSRTLSHMPGGWEAGRQPPR